MTRSKLELLGLFGLLFIISALIQANPCLAKTKDFSTLRYMLTARNEDPRIYLPSSGFLGSDMEVLVVAPAAKSVKLLASSNPGTSHYQDVELALANDYQEIGTVKKDKASFKINLDPLSNKKSSLISAFDYTGDTKNLIYFEALAVYDDGKGGEIIKQAHFYGSNANFSNQNSVEIKAPTKDSSSVANMARTFLPGLMQAGSGNARYQ